METRYIILENGVPSWQNALELPCTSREKAEAEITRLEAMQRENNEKAAAWKPQGLKGEFFMRPQHDSRIFTIKEFQV